MFSYVDQFSYIDIDRQSVSSFQFLIFRSYIVCVFGICIYLQLYRLWYSVHEYLWSNYDAIRANIVRSSIVCKTSYWYGIINSDYTHERNWHKNLLLICSWAQNTSIWNSSFTWESLENELRVVIVVFFGLRIVKVITKEKQNVCWKVLLISKNGQILFNFKKFFKSVKRNISLTCQWVNKN